MNDIPFKQCSNKEACVQFGQRGWLPATVEYFYRYLKNTDGLMGICKECKKTYSRNYEATHPDQTKERKCLYGIAHRTEISEKTRARNLADPEPNRARARKWSKENPRKRHEQYLRRKTRDPEFIKRQSQKQRREHPESIKERRRRNHLKHPEKAREYKLIRKSREKTLPFDFPPEKEARMFDYWQGSCAICGRKADMWTYLAIDHWIPLTDKRPGNPGAVSTNLVPLCHAKKGSPSGTPSCNASKHNHDPETWLIQRFGKRRARAILKRINVYFDWVREQDS